MSFFPAGVRVTSCARRSLSLGRRAFGRPSRITARVRLGRGELVDIEREVALGGPIHSKGVLILAGYLGARYDLHVTGITGISPESEPSPARLVDQICWYHMM